MCRAVDRRRFCDRGACAALSRVIITVRGSSNLDDVTLTVGDLYLAVGEVSRRVYSQGILQPLCPADQRRALRLEVETHLRVAVCEMEVKISAEGSCVLNSCPPAVNLILICSSSTWIAPRSSSLRVSLLLAPRARHPLKTWITS